MTEDVVRVCFVCLGNICRSPTGEGVMRKLVADAGLTRRIEIDSAGTAAFHVGERADPRSREAARKRGIDLTSRARAFSPADFDAFDYVLAMDLENRKNLNTLARSAADRQKLFLLRAFDPESPPDAEIPDPYYGGELGFERVLDLCEAACSGLLEAIRAGQEMR